MLAERTETAAEPSAGTTYLGWPLQEGGCNLHRNGGDTMIKKRHTVQTPTTQHLRAAASAACSEVANLHREEVGLASSPASHTEALQPL